MDLEKILKYLLPIIPEPLRKHVASCIVLLCGEAALEIGIERFPWATVLSSRYFLFCLCLTSTYWLIVSMCLHSKIAPWKLAVMIVLFLATATLAGYGVFLHYNDLYNQLGFFESRQWRFSEIQPRDTDSGRWFWNMDAVEDLSKEDLTVRMPRTSCQFEDFSPEVSASGFVPTITDVSPDAASSDAWRISEFRRPSKLTFYLVVKGRQPELSCALPQINMTSKP